MFLKEYFFFSVFKRVPMFHINLWKICSPCCYILGQVKVCNNNFHLIVITFVSLLLYFCCCQYHVYVVHVRVRIFLQALRARGVWIVYGQKILYRKTFNSSLFWWNYSVTGRYCLRILYKTSEPLHFSDYLLLWYYLLCITTHFLSLFA